LAKWPDRVICGTGILCFAVVVFIGIYYAWNELEIANLYFLTVFVCIGVVEIAASFKRFEQASGREKKSGDN
jgi:xanthine/uracil permease